MISLDFDRYASGRKIEHHEPGNMTFHGGQPIKGLVAYGKECLILIHDEHQEGLSYIGHLKGWTLSEHYKTPRFYEKIAGIHQTLFLFRTDEGIVDVFEKAD